jgi:RAT1-interacting protein
MPPAKRRLPSPGFLEEERHAKSARTSHSTASGSTPSSTATQSYLTYPPPHAPPPAVATAFQQPVPLLTYSHDTSHVQVFDDSSMKYLNTPSAGCPINLNLNHRYENWVRKPDVRGRLDGLLVALERVKNEVGGRLDVGVVSWRGVMTK